MPIVNSEILGDNTQIDGRRHIQERHTDHVGGFHLTSYMAGLGDDVTLALPIRAGQITTQLNENEIAANMAKALNAETVFTFTHSTVDENMTAMRGLFKDATKWELMTLAWVIDDVDLTDNKLKQLFSVDDTGLVGIKAKLTNIAGKYTDALALIGQ